MAKPDEVTSVPTELVQPYEPTDREQSAIAARHERRDARMPHARLKVENERDGNTVNCSITVDHPDQKVGWDLLTAGMGLSDGTAAGAFIEQISALATGKESVSEQKANELLALVQEIAPRDPIEALLAVQMASVHSAAMLQAAALNASLVQPGQYKRYESHSNAFNKLTRTFTAQMEALKRYRSKGVQKVVVEHQHIHVHPGAQAVVGDVIGQGVGGQRKNEGQPHERETMRIPQRAPMLREVKADGVPVQGASGEGVESLPLSRGQGWAANG